MITKAQIEKLKATGKVDDVENEGMDEGRFFVHLNEGHDFCTDPHNVIRTKSFGGYAEAYHAVKNAERLA